MDHEGHDDAPVDGEAMDDGLTALAETERTDEEAPQGGEAPVGSELDEEGELDSSQDVGGRAPGKAGEDHEAEEEDDFELSLDYEEDEDVPEGLVNGEGLTNGAPLVNGAGMTNGTGLTNGSGMTNGQGLTNGVGMTNGKGLTNGDGMTNGVGMTNGTGLTNGDGMTNGAGMTNGQGLTNGSGMVNGSSMVNGNGMVNGSGMTNGEAEEAPEAVGHDWALVPDVGEGAPEGHRLRASYARRRKERSRTAVVLVSILMIVTPILVIYSGLLEPEEDRIIIDGLFEDWDGVTEYLDSRGETQGSNPVDLVSWRIVSEEDFLAARVSTLGSFQGFEHEGEEGDVTLHLLVDSDGRASTGYDLGTIGADMMVRVTVGSQGQVAAQRLEWDETFRTEGGEERERDDWHGWAGAPGKVEAAQKGGDLELKADLLQPLAQGAMFVASTADAFGRWDLSDAPVDGSGPTLLVRQSRAAPDVLPAGESDVLHLDLTALGGDVEVSAIDVAAEGATAAQPTVPVSVSTGPPTRVTVRGDVPTGSDGTLVVVGLDGSDAIDAGDARVVLEGIPTLAYAISPPDEVSVDGAFGDWDLTPQSQVTDGTGDVVMPPYAPMEDEGVDLSAVSASVSTSTLDLYAMVEDGMLEGLRVPLVPISSPVGAVDVDGDGRLDLTGDGVEDGYGTLDNDYDNDNGLPDDPDNPVDPDTGVDDVDKDDDNDGVPDTEDPVKGGPHVPGEPTALPELTGKETVEFLIDTDGSTDTGYSPGGLVLGADHRVVVKGRDGIVSSAKLQEHHGPPSVWDWTDVTDVETGVDGTRLEVGLDVSGLDLGENVTILARAVGWTGAKDWSDRVLERSPATMGDILAGRGVAVMDPYAVAANGSFSISPDGTVWTQKGGPSDPGAFVDVAVGQDGLDGYVYGLTAEGKVYVTTRAVEGWTEYGQGEPYKPETAAYVAIATGRGNTRGYVYILRNDGTVFVTDRATNGWSQYGQGTPAIPGSTAYVDLAPGGVGLEGSVYTLRTDGKVYVATSAVTGWTEYGQGTPAAPSSHPDYTAIGTGDGTTKGYVYTLRASGEVYVATSAVTGWTRYAPGTPAIPTSGGYCDLDAATTAHPGRVMVVDRDGSAYVADSAVGGWAKYGQGTPAIPASVGYTAVALGPDDLPGYVYVMSEEGAFYVCDNAVRGWARYGTGTPTIPSGGGHSSVVGTGGDTYLLMLNGTVWESADGGDSWSYFGQVDTANDDGWVSMVQGASGELYALRRDGTVRHSPTSSSSWSTHGDAGAGTCWVGIASDQDTYLYAIRADGVASHSKETSTSWSSKGDAGDGTCWVGIASFDDSSDVYAIRSDRTIARCDNGASSTWSTWSTAASDPSWVAVATNGTHVFALRNDGRVDRALIAVTPSWTNSLGDVGTDTAWTDFSVPIPELPSLLLQALVTISLVFFIRRRRMHVTVEVEAESDGGDTE